ncbi:hypothetical protein [Novosphingobium sp.]|uniref:hypothetical protein n=1 Tax=Novosphingobium sp. TaxID=1874826 RepID=UPI00261C569B|nr:hypothetical protein [Novosphingobium sp.]
MLLLIAAATMMTADPTEVRVRRELHAAPRPVRTFLVRRAGCNHWGGEEGYDVERAAQIADAARKLRCRQIEADEKRIKRKYAKSRRVRWLLATTRDWDTLP